MESLAAYNKAYAQAVEHPDRASNARHIAVTSWKLATQNFSGAGSAKANDRVMYYFKEAVTYFDRAMIHGRKGKMADKWMESLKVSFHECLDDITTFAQEEDDYEKRISILETFKQLINAATESKAKLSLEIGTQIFRLATTVLQNENYKKALCCLREIYQPIEEARRCAGECQEILTEVNVLEDDAFMAQCKAQSLQSRATGDTILEKAINEDEELDLTAIFEVLDWYKQASLLTRELEIEMEAIANSRLGMVFAKVLKINYKAKDYYQQSIQLAHSMTPRNFHGVDWYDEAAKFVDKYQKERLQQESDKWQIERKEYLEQLKDELEVLKEEANFGYNDSFKAVAFLQFLYKTHPPKKNQKLPPEEDMKAMDKSGIKDLYKKALLHYHPDKNKASKHGKKWMTLCEEITKFLTSHYMSYKFD